MKRRTQLAVVAVVAIIVVSAVALGPTLLQPPTTVTPPKELTKVRMQLNWVFDSNQAGFFVAQELGYYTENGLEVELFPGRGAVYAIDQVVAGNAEFGVTGLNFILPQKAAGKQVTAIALLYANHPASYFTLRPDISGPQDFAGKRIAVQKGSAADYNIFKTLLKQFNIDPASITEVPITFDMWTPLILNQADVSMGWFTNAISFRQAGVNMSKVKIFRAADYGLNIVSTGVFARDDVIQTKPEVVRAFVNASLYGWKYAFEHPGEAVDIILKANPDLKREIESELIIWYLRDAIWGEPFKTKGLGWFDDANWARTQNIYFDAGIVKEKAALSTIYTTAFLPTTPIFPNSPYAPRP
jgi:ABC-type nitrate/sulfonate/bicarbonate transport system substrate-binding protein